MKKYLIYCMILAMSAVRGQHGPQSLSDTERQYRQAKVHEDLPTVASTATQAGALYLQSKNYKRSTDYLLVAKDIYKKQRDSVALARVSCLLAQNYWASGNAKRFKDYTDLAAQLLKKQTHLPEYLLLLDTQIAYFESKGKTKQAQYLIDEKMRLTAQNTPIATAATAPAQAAAVPAVQPARSKEENLAVTAPEDEIVSTTSTLDLDQLAMLLAISIAVVSFIGMIYFSYRDRNRTLAQQRDLKTLQAQMIGNLSRAVESLESDRELKNLSRQLAAISMIKAGQKQPGFIAEPVGPFVQTLVAPFLERAAAKNVKVISNLERSAVKQLLDKETVQALFDLIADEALAQTSFGDKIYLSVTIEKARLRMRVSYQHVLLEKEALDELFSDLEHTKSLRRNPVGFALLGALTHWYRGSAQATHDGQMLSICVELPLSEPARSVRQMAALW